MTPPMRCSHNGASRVASASNLLFIAAMLLLSATVMAEIDADMRSLPSLYDSAMEDRMMGRIEASLMGESALIDRETGRVYWEGASEHTLYESVLPKLDQMVIGIADHLQSIVLTTLLYLVIIGFIKTRWGLPLYSPTPAATTATSAASAATSAATNQAILMITRFLYTLFHALSSVSCWMYNHLPAIESRWMIAVIIIFYFLESYGCTTRRFLANAIDSPTQLEDYMDQMRTQQPAVTWTVKAFHYEPRHLHLPSLPALLKRLGHKLLGDRSDMLRAELQAIGEESRDINNSIVGGVAVGNTDNAVATSSSMERSDASFATNQTQQQADVPLSVPLPPSPSKACPPRFPFTKKVISYQASQDYVYGSCQDSIMSGVWKRASSTSTTRAPFTKLTLTKLLVLSDQKSREDYFRQQSDFVTNHGHNDEFVEFSTDIQVLGYKRRMLAVQPVDGVHGTSSKLIRLHLFWLCTLCGMTLPYRLWFARHCDSLRVTIVKETNVRPPSSSSLSWWKGGAVDADGSLADEESKSQRIWRYAQSWFPSASSLTPHKSMWTRRSEPTVLDDES